MCVVGRARQGLRTWGAFCLARESEPTNAILGMQQNDMGRECMMHEWQDAGQDGTSGANT